jgi:hypothetical protein
MRPTGRPRPELVEVMRASDELSREAVRSLFGAEILGRAGPKFEDVLDVICTCCAAW